MCCGPVRQTTPGSGTGTLVVDYVVVDGDGVEQGAFPNVFEARSLADRLGGGATWSQRSRTIS